MLLLHISDIHFQYPVCTTANDADRPFRALMVQDVRAQVSELGPVGAILVTGDIAYRAHPDEYKAAFVWLMELAEAGGCPKERIFVVPGNHDIDRSAITKSPAVRNVQLAVKTASDAKREKVLLEQFSDAATGGALCEPLAAYNEFAKHFECQVYTPDRLCWHQKLPLAEGIFLRLHGLTSTLISGAPQESGSQNDIRGSLYLSPLQTVLTPSDGEINLVMSHHPPDWLLDIDEVEDAVQGRALLHLFGHKHRQRVMREVYFMRFSAGAVSPDRQENGWEPGYNLINLAVVGDVGMVRNLQIDARVMKWQTNPDRYVPKLTREGNAIFSHAIGITNNATKIPKLHEAAKEPSLLLEASRKAEVEMSSQATRNLVMRFWNLTMSQRREIALKLGIIVETDMKIPEPERYGRALLLAGERGLLEQLAHEVEQRERIS
jgi:predicted phosphodiesterase